MQRLFRGNTIFVMLLLVAVFFAGYYFGETRNNQTAALPFFNNKDVVEPVDVDFSPVWKSWNVLEEKFVPANSTTSVTDEDKVWGMIQGLAESYGDPHTVFFPPRETELFENDIRGNFGGVGMEIGLRDEVLTVIAPLKGTPADNAGIQAGDKVLEIDGESTNGISVEEAVEKIRGEIGTTVELTLSRNGVASAFTVSIERGVIQIPTIDTRTEEGGIFVIELYNFNANAGNLFRGALREFIQSGADKLIIDLRGNPGGYLEVAIEIGSWFLPTGKIIVEEDFGANGDPRFHRSRGYDIFSDELKIVILTNQGSASASEILAGALQAHEKATLIGTRTYGKGSVQELVKITPDTSLKVTIARWLTPNGTSISDGGLTPDIEVSVTAEEVEAGLDPQFDRAVEFLTN